MAEGSPQQAARSGVSQLFARRETIDPVSGLQEAHVHARTLHKDRRFQANA